MNIHLITSMQKAAVRFRRRHRLPAEGAVFVSKGGNEQDGAARWEVSA